MYKSQGYSILQEYNGTTIRIDIETAYVCLKDMEAAAGKFYQDWCQIEDHSDFLKLLASEEGIPSSELLVVHGSEALRWAHPMIALNFAKWSSDDFVDWLFSRYEEIGITTKNS